VDNSKDKSYDWNNDL